MAIGSLSSESGTVNAPTFRHLVFAAQNDVLDETIEPHGVGFGRHAGNQISVAALEVRLDEALTLLLAVPLLQKVND